MNVDRSVNSFSHRIWVAGNAEDAKRICRAYCLEVGLCVTVTETEFVYTGGSESGVVVGLLHYPRFPTSEYALLLKATTLACRLRDGLSQRSVLIESADHNRWLSREDVPR